MTMPNEPALVEITLEDGSCIQVRAVIADRVRGIDADGDPVVPLGTPEAPICRDDGAEYLYPLTPCCQASGKGSESSTGVVCRACYREVHIKYGGFSEVAVNVAEAGVEAEPQ